MNITDLFHEIYSAITANKVRSGLTVLGIVIGIASVIAMISIGQGAQNSIQASIESMGSNLLIVRPGAQSIRGVSYGRGSIQSLTLDDAEYIEEKALSAKAVSPEVSTRSQVTAKGTNTNTTIYGVTPEYMDVRNVQVAEGSFISDQNIRSLTKVAVIGPTVKIDLFGENATNVLGQKIRIGSNRFTIIGVTVEKGGTGFGSQDDLIYIPITTAQRFLIGNSYVSSINVKAVDSESMDFLNQELTSLLLTKHNIRDPQLADFSILNQADIIDTASSVTQTLTILLGAIAGISLIVGGIGIMNMMLTSVTERTREIGLRKAIGAKRADISNQFLMEAIALTLVGGILGIVLGWVGALVIGGFTGLDMSISLFSIILAFGVSTLIGIVFGYYPARQAAKLNPIQALRYE